MLIQSSPSRVALCLGAALASALALPARPASACGCFAPPNVATPVVQAGEKILFAPQNGVVTMHVQILYNGQPGDFGWLMPLPAIPKNSAGIDGPDVGVNELFDQLSATTQPAYVLQRIPCPRAISGSGIGCGASSNDVFGAAAPGDAALDMGAFRSPLVKQDSVGPYDYAILNASNQNDMFTWLNNNRYVVPTGTDKVVAPYLGMGRYFLALKLRPGAQVGDLRPVVLHYQADLSMIPIILTSVTATPNMGILVWVLGSGRAIPRNYYHTVINDAQLDWLNGVQNYADVVQKAVGEAEGKHAFVTEYAGTSAVMRDRLDAPGRFDALARVMTENNPVRFVQAILQQLAPDGQTVLQPGFALNGQLTAILGRYIPEPMALINSGVLPSDYYSHLDFYLADPSKYPDIQMALMNFNPATLAQDLTDHIVKPSQEAGKLFSSLPYLTRMYTVMSPENMTADPAFSYNPTLPDVPNTHTATLNLPCNSGDPSLLTTASGFKVSFSSDEVNRSAYKPQPTPYSQRIERLQDTGAPVVVVDNTAMINGSITTMINGSMNGGGCVATRNPAYPPGVLSLLLLGLISTALLLRRRLAWLRR